MNKNSEILIVDDDKIVLDSLKTLFEIENISAQYFDNPINALEFIKTNKPKVIVSDVIMPQMDGIKFLNEVKKIHDDITLILLTGYADKQSAICAINTIGIYKYIEKPWDNDNLILNIKNALERSELISSLKQKISLLDEANFKLEKYSKQLEVLVEEKTQDLVRINSKLNAIFENCADGIIVFNSSGFINSANNACEILSGFCSKLLINKKIDNILINENNINLLDKLSIEKNIILRDFYIKNILNENKIPVEINIAPINNLDGERLFVGVIRNVFAQKEMDRLRDDFIATLTHDLRTPLLASIQTLDYFIDETLGKVNEKQLKFLKTMKLSNEDMLGLVNALLEVYRYESGKLKLFKTNFNLNDFLTKCISELTSLIIKKDIKYDLEIAQTENYDIYADKNELRRVVINLCGNAIKYTKCGGEIKVKTQIRNKDDLQVTILDTGIGINSDDISKMFKRFSRGTSQNRTSGVGLGLYLSKQIIEAHRGKIWAQSVENEGSEFSFLLIGALKYNVNNRSLKSKELKL